MDRERALKDVYFLKDLSAEELDLFRARATQEQFPMGTRILEEGFGGLKMYFLLEGKVRVLRKLGERELIITLLESPQTFGEISVVDGEPASASVEAETDTVALALHRDDFFEVLKGSQSIQAKVWNNLALEMCRRVRSTTNQVLDYFAINQALVENENFRNFYKHFGV
jgi:CRP-like cAMP-binding protein